MEILLLWALVGGLLGAAIGSTKNRLHGGFWLGLVLGPIGWLLIIVGPDYRPKCPECKGVIVPGAARCKNCGAALQRSAAPPDRRTQRPPKT
jgi:hypothetical protein